MASGKGGWGEQGDAAFVAGLMQILSQGNGSLAFCAHPPFSHSPHIFASLTSQHSKRAGGEAEKPRKTRLKSALNEDEPFGACHRFNHPLPVTCSILCTDLTKSHSICSQGLAWASASASASASHAAVVLPRQMLRQQQVRLFAPIVALTSQMTCRRCPY